VKRTLRGIGMTSQRTRDRLAARLEREGIRDPRVLTAVRETPRHIFIDEALAHRAYDDTALPIGHAQTISQPYVVARMTEALLGAEQPRKVLEIGTGCGYQAAVLARIAERVYSVERIAALLARARENLHSLGLHNVRLRHGDGFQGWAEHAPYDAIIVTAAPVEVPPALLEQLTAGGRIVLPVGREGVQDLRVLERTDTGVEEGFLDHVSFVPMLGGTD